MGQLLFKNVRAIVTCDPEDHVFYHTDILVDGPAILKIDKMNYLQQVNAFVFE